MGTVSVRTRGPSAPKDQTKIYFTQGDFLSIQSPNNYVCSKFTRIISRRNIAAAIESAMSEDDVEVVAEYEGAAAGWRAPKAIADAVRDQKAIVKETRGLLKMNQPHGFDCPGSAWPDPKHTSSFEFFE
jgi:hypothetical protein